MYAPSVVRVVNIVSLGLESERERVKRKYSVLHVLIVEVYSEGGQQYKGEPPAPRRVATSFFIHQPLNSPPHTLTTSTIQNIITTCKDIIQGGCLTRSCQATILVFQSWIVSIALGRHR